MRYWVASCSILMGVVSIAGTGDPARVLVSIVLGAGIGVILYGLFVALSSAWASKDQFLHIGGIDMHRFIWAGVLLVTVVVQSTQTEFMYALGFTVPWFVCGLILSPIWWGVTKKNRESPWQWYDWLNVGSYIMVILFVFFVITREHMSSQGFG